MTGLSVIPWALASMFAAASISPSTRTAEVLEERESDIGRQLTVMSRVLEKRLEAEWMNEIVTASLIQRGIEGYYAAGIGALFFVDARFAVVAPEAPKTPEKSQPDDLWTRTEREIESVGGAVPFEGSIVWKHNRPPSPIARPSFDAKKVERLKAVLLDTLAQYGNRLESVADSEHLVIIVSGGAFPPPLVMAPWTGAGDTSRSVLIVSVLKKDLGRDTKDLAARATIIAYRY